MTKYIYLLLCCFLISGAQAQSWTYIGGACTNQNGSAEIEFKSNGNIISVAYEYDNLKIKEFDGSSWNALPNLPISGSLTNPIGGFDLELYKDTPFISVYKAGFQVYKFDGSNWQQLGSTVSGTYHSFNADFAISSTGHLYQVNGGTRRLHHFDGTTWNLDYTFPTSEGSKTLSYAFNSDHTLNFDGPDELIYMVTRSDSTQFMRKYVAGVESNFGNTILTGKWLPIKYGIFKNNSNEIFVNFAAVTLGTRHFIKKKTGSDYINFGDSTANTIENGTMYPLGFLNDSSIAVASQGTTNKKIHFCLGSGGTYTVSDSFPTGSFAQISDLKVNPLTHQVYVAYGCVAPSMHSVLKYEMAGSNIKTVELNNLNLFVYPNPAQDKINIRSNEKAINYQIRDMTGRTILSGIGSQNEMDVANLANGLYILEAKYDSQTEKIKFIISH